MYNYWEPVHLLTQTHGKDTAFETWEYVPQYAIRSWAYAAMHAIVPYLITRMSSLPPYAAFYALRFVLAVLSSVSDALLYEQVARHVHVRVARYLLVFLTVCAGMLSASTALLPSSFVMYTTSLAMAFAMQPASTQAWRRTFYTTAVFAFGALAGWPYAIILAAPYVYEELCLCGSDPSCEHTRRLARWLRAVMYASLLAAPIVLIDTLAYGRVTVAPLNTILYNVASRARGISPELYGVEPPSYYVVALALAFSMAAPLALAALPMIAITAVRYPMRFAPMTSATTTFTKTESASPAASAHNSHGSQRAVLLALRVLPLYLWLGLLMTQPHKEERFLYPAYPLVCVNAAVTLYLVRACMEQAYLSITRSPYRASRTMLFSAVTVMPLVVTAVLGTLRIMALIEYYRAPLQIGHAVSQIQGEHTLCYAKEWHRFPSHFFVPRDMQVAFVESDFRGILPHHFHEAAPTRQPGPHVSSLSPRTPFESKLLHALEYATPVLWPWAKYTRTVPASVNERNQHEPDRYVPLSQCTLLVDVDVPTRAASDAEPRYVHSDEWDTVLCKRFLDNEASRHAAQAQSITMMDKVYATLARTLWFPPGSIGRGNSARQFGDYCLLRRRT